MSQVNKQKQQGKAVKDRGMSYYGVIVVSASVMIGIIANFIYKMIQCVMKKR